MSRTKAETNTEISESGNPAEELHLGVAYRVALREGNVAAAEDAIAKERGAGGLRELRAAVAKAERGALAVGDLGALGVAYDALAGAALGEAGGLVGNVGLECER